MVLRRWWLVLGLLVSVGVNVGVLATLAIARLTAGPAPVAGETEIRPAPPEAPSGGPEAESGGVVASEERVPERPPPPAAAGSSTSIASSESPPASPAAGEEAATGEPRPEPSDLPGPKALPQALAPRLERLADHLGLEDPARARFIALQREMFANVLASERQRLRLQVELRRELIGPSPDAARVQELIRRQAALHAEAEAATARAILESRRLLDPDQERRYLAIVAQLGPRLRQEAVRRWRENRPGARPLPGRRFPGRRPR